MLHLFTRMFLFVPFFFIFAMIGLDWLLKLIAGITNQPGKIYYAAISVVLVLAGISILMPPIDPDL